jgi:hypothetical protein
VRTPLATALSLLVLFDGGSWTIGVIPTLQYAFTHRTLPTLGGLRLLAGPFEALGMDAFVVAGIVFVVVSLLKFLAAYWIWNARKDGAVLELILLGLSTIFWYGFALPLGLVEGLAQLVLLAGVWKTLS